LTRERPIPLGLAFLAGGALICAVTGTVIVILVRVAGLNSNNRRTPSAWVDIVLGVAIAAFTAVLLTRDWRRHRADPPGGRPLVDGPLGESSVSGKIDRSTTADPSTGDNAATAATATGTTAVAVAPSRPGLKAFVTGVAVYLPMLSYFASVKIVASQEKNVAVIVVAVLVCIVVSLLITEVPLLIVVLAPDRSESVLNKMSAVVARYTRPALLIFGGAAGIYLIIKGFAAL
jgi:hypothetical protein